jgi:hypothetical protein
MANTKVQSEQIEDGSITADKLADGTIVAAELADNAVVTAAINADAVTGAKIADNAIDSEHYTDGSIDTAHIADSQITVGKMAANSVDSDQYVDGSIDTVHLADLQVTTAKIANGNISTAKIADNAVTSAKIDTNIDIAGTLDVTGATVLDSTLGVAGNVTTGNSLILGGNDNEEALLTIRYSTVPTYISSTFDGSDAISAFSTNQYNNDDGSASLSSITNSSYSSAAIKMYANTADSSIRFYTATAANTTPTEYMRVDHDGKVGIGETSPLATLHIKQGDSGLSSLNAAAHHLFLEDTGSNGPGITFASGTTSNCTLAFGDSDSNYRGFILYDNSADQLKMGTSGSEVLRVDTNLLVNGGAVSAPSYSFIGDANTGMSRPTSDAINFVTGGTERIRITDAGKLCVNTTSAINLAHTFQVNHAGNNVAVFNNIVTSGNPYGIQLRYSGQGHGTGGDAYTYYSNTSGSYVLKFGVKATGNVVNANNSYGQVSDRKLKENIVDATNKLDELKQIKIRNFNFIGDDTKQIGVVAQELETIFPSLITDTEDVDADGNNAGTTTKEVKYSVLLPIAIKAIQEQQTIIEAQTTSINDLKTRIEALES